MLILWCLFHNGRTADVPRQSEYSPSSPSPLGTVFCLDLVTVAVKQQQEFGQ